MILPPVDDDAGHVSERDGDDGTDKGGERKKRVRGGRKAKQTQGGKFAAGLSLMHGFSARNVSGGRITVR